MEGSHPIEEKIKILTGRKLLPPIRKKCRTGRFCRKAIMFLLSSTRTQLALSLLHTRKAATAPRVRPPLNSLCSPRASIARLPPHRKKPATSRRIRSRRGKVWLLRGRKRWIEAASPLLHEAAIESPASRGSAFLRSSPWRTRTAPTRSPNNR
jgi:hypothetical protein